MGRPRRSTPADLVYHMLNRGNGRMRLFEDDGDYVAFERVLAEGSQRIPMRIVAYCLMPNHWHLILWPTSAGGRVHATVRADLGSSHRSTAAGCAEHSGRELAVDL